MQAEKSEHSEIHGERTITGWTAAGRLAMVTVWQKSMNEANMYAIFEDGSRQYRVQEGDVVKVDFRDAQLGSSIEFGRVLLLENNADAKIGQPTIAGAKGGRGSGRFPVNEDLHPEVPPPQKLTPLHRPPPALCRRQDQADHGLIVPNKIPVPGRIVFAFVDQLTLLPAGDEYNSGGEMTSAEEQTSLGGIENQISYEYDIFGQLVAEDVNGTTTKYAVDGWNPAKMGATGTSNFDVWATFTSGGSLISRQIQGDGIDQHLAYVTSSNAYWYLTDHLGSTRAVINNSGTVQDSIVYDAYGNITYQTPSPSTTPLYTYTGRELDVETGLQYNRARWYDPSTGRWISQDPMGFDAGDSNLYRYVANEPTLTIDASGLQPGQPVQDTDVYGQAENESYSYGLPPSFIQVFQKLTKVGYHFTFQSKISYTKSDTGFSEALQRSSSRHGLLFVRPGRQLRRGAIVVFFGSISPWVCLRAEGGHDSHHPKNRSVPKVLDRRETQDNPPKWRPFFR